jgi:hypothetical protein
MPPFFDISDFFHLFLDKEDMILVKFFRSAEKREILGVVVCFSENVLDFCPMNS